MAGHTLGVVIGNRDFFPDVLVSEARRDILALCAKLDVECVLLGEIGTYAAASGVPNTSLVLMAKLGGGVLEWATALDLDATAIQCWSSLQQHYGVNCCTVMSMMSEQLMPSACEVDVAGAVSMYALQLASGRPSALVDWNNNYGDDPDKCVFFHCGNWAKAFLPDAMIATAPILGTTLGEKKTYGALSGRTPGGQPVTFGRISTDDRNGRVTAYVGEGLFTDDPLQTFGARAVVEIPNLQKLMRTICRRGFEHHAAMNASKSADAPVAAAVRRAAGRRVARREYARSARSLADHRGRLRRPPSSARGLLGGFVVNLDVRGHFQRAKDGDISNEFPIGLVRPRAMKPLWGGWTSRCV